MSSSVAVVTDSTAYLPADLVTRHRITVVPLQVIVGSRTYDEGREATPQTIAEALRRYVPVSTSRPSPGAFAEAYSAAAAAGATSVVSVHLSKEISGTYDSALLAAGEAALPVRVVDSGTLGMGLGFAVLAAAQSAGSGAGPDEVADAAAARAAGTSCFFYVDTLEHLRRGGRIGAAAALVGSALAVKPLLTLVDGRIAPLEKVRTAARAIARLEELAVARALSAAEGTSHDPVDLAVHHLASEARAQVLAEHLRARVSRLGDLLVGEVGAVIGAHTGPGMLAVVVSPRTVHRPSAIH